MRTRGAAVLVALVAALAVPAGAVDGDVTVDPSFGGGGVVTTRLGGSGARDLVIQPDGKLLAGGTGSGGTFAVARYNPDGSLDPTFGGDGVVATTVGGLGDPYALALQPDGRIVQAGVADRAVGLVRYNPDGTLDTSFGAAGIVTTPIDPGPSLANDVALLPDGRIVVGGTHFTALGGQFAVVRYTPDGGLDPTFGGEGVALVDFGEDTVEGAEAVAVQPDGRIVAAGRFRAPLSASRIALVRLNPDGGLDSAFDGDGRSTAVTGAATDVVVQADGGIVVASSRLVRYRGDGSLDTGFGTAGTAGTSGFSGAAVVLRPGGGFLLAGQDSSRQIAVAAYRADGSADPVFDGDHLTRTSIPVWTDGAAVVVQPDGAVVVAGTRGYERFSQVQDFVLVRYRVDPAGPGRGYSLVASDGGVFAFGRAPFLGSTGNMALAGPVVGMAPDPDGSGYWLMASDGGVFTFGDARFLGSAAEGGRASPFVAIASFPGAGYVLAAADGETRVFGRPAGGSLEGRSLNAPIVGAATSANGYWLVAADGGVFTIGDVAFLGSTGGMALNQPIVGMAVHPGGNGYWLVAADGGVFTFGDAPFLGSTGGMRLNQPVVGMAADPDGNGYWLVAADGGVFTFGDAPFLGSMGGTRLARPVLGITARS